MRTRRECGHVIALSVVVTHFDVFRPPSARPALVSQSHTTRTLLDTTLPHPRGRSPHRHQNSRRSRRTLSSAWGARSLSCSLYTLRNWWNYCAQTRITMRAERSTSTWPWHVQSSPTGHGPVTPVPPPPPVPCHSRESHAPPILQRCSPPPSPTFLSAGCPSYPPSAHVLTPSHVRDPNPHVQPPLTHHRLLTRVLSSNPRLSTDHPLPRPPGATAATSAGAGAT